MVQLDKLAIAVILFVVMITAGFLIIGNIAYNYNDVDGIDMDFDKYSELNETVTDIFGEMNSTTGGMSGKILNSTSESTTEDSMYKGGFSAIRLVFNIPKLIYQTVNVIAIELQIPPFFISVFMIALVLMIIFAIIYIILRIKA